jgi:hypothetical protein
MARRFYRKGFYTYKIGYISPEESGLDDEVWLATGYAGLPRLWYGDFLTRDHCKLAAISIDSENPEIIDMDPHLLEPIDPINPADPKIAGDYHIPKEPLIKLKSWIINNYNSLYSYWNNHLSWTDFLDKVIDNKLRKEGWVGVTLFGGTAENLEEPQILVNQASKYELSISADVGGSCAVKVVPPDNDHSKAFDIIVGKRLKTVKEPKNEFYGTFSKAEIKKIYTWIRKNKTTLLQYCYQGFSRDQLDGFELSEFLEFSDDSGGAAEVKGLSDRELMSFL